MNLTIVKRCDVLKRLKKFASIRVLGYPDIRRPEEDNVEIHSASIVKAEWPKAMRKPFIGLTRDSNANPYWTKYRRFLENNNFDFEIFEYHRSDWCERAKEYDLVIWSPSSGPAELEEVKRKIYILEQKCGKKCFPDYETLLLCDDKVISTYCLEMCDLPVAETFISNSFTEIEEKKKNFRYPLVSKLFHGASSREVSLVNNPEELFSIARKAFSFHGRKTHNPYFRQKNYIYFQRFIEGDGLDVRVNIAGNAITGYFRKPKGGDFRASGSGIVIKEDLPIEAIEIALRTYRKLGKAMLGVDMMKDTTGRYWIIEISPFIGVRTPTQLKVNGVPGTYFLLEDGTLDFRIESYWPQELALKVFLEQNYLTTEEEWKKKHIDSALSKGTLRKRISYSQ